MSQPLVLASGSEIRQQLLRNAGLSFDVMPARIDENAIKTTLLAEDAKPRDIADTLAEMKARKVSQKLPGALVLGCDQVLAHKTDILSKPKSQDDLRQQLDLLSGETHQLLSAAVLYEDNAPVWRHVGVARLTMKRMSETYLDSYITRNWESIRHSVGGYKLEEEGIRLFSQIQGDYFCILGLPLLELLSYLGLRGVIET